MGSLEQALAIVLAINVVLWLGQVSVLALVPPGSANEFNGVTPYFYNCKDTILGNAEANRCTTNNTHILDTSDPSAKLPNQGSQVQISSGNIFTDTFSAAVNWFTQSTGLHYLYDILSAPVNILKAIGVPAEFSFAIGAMWYLFTLFLIVAFVLGGNV